MRALLCALLGVAWVCADSDASVTGWHPRELAKKHPRPLSNTWHTTLIHTAHPTPSPHPPAIPHHSPTPSRRINFVSFARASIDFSGAAAHCIARHFSGAAAHFTPTPRSCALPAGCSLPALAPLPLPALVPGPRRLACRPPTAWPLLRWLGWSCGLRCCALLLLPSCGRCSASSLLSDGSRAFCYLAQVGVYIRCQPRQLTSRGRLAACRLRNSG